MPRSDVEVNTTVLNRILRNLDENAENAVLAVAFDVEAKAKVRVQQQHAIDTGAYVNSYYTRGYRGDFQNSSSVSFGQIESHAQGLRPDARLKELPAPRNRAEAMVGPTVEYAIYVELGTTTRSARPSLEPAVREAERQLAARFGNVCTDGAR